MPEVKRKFEIIHPGQRTEFNLRIFGTPHEIFQYFRRDNAQDNFYRVKPIGSNNKYNESQRIATFVCDVDEVGDSGETGEIIWRDSYKIFIMPRMASRQVENHILRGNERREDFIYKIIKIGEGLRTRYLVDYREEKLSEGLLKGDIDSIVNEYNALEYLIKKGMFRDKRKKKAKRTPYSRFDIMDLSD